MPCSIRLAMRGAHAVDERLAELIADERPLAVAEPVVMDGASRGPLAGIHVDPASHRAP